MGLFNVSIATGTTSIVEQPSKVSPLAIAFLVGYSVDVFFTFLEGLIQGFRQRQPAS